MKKLLMSVAALFMGWSMVSAQDYSAEFKDAEGAQAAFGEQTFTLAGKEWYATCGYYDKDNANFRLGRREKDADKAKPVESKFTTLGISEQGAVLEMNWDFENITSFNITSSYNWEANNKVTLLVSTDGGTTYQIVKTETISVKDPSNTVVERYFSDETARAKARYALALEGEKAGVCRLNLTEVYTNKQAGVDETAPEISYIVTASATTTAVEVHFNEALEQTSAETAANYTMNNSITVSAAKLGEDGKTVTLTTTAMTEGTAYELTVNGVKDLADNATENLKYAFTFGAIEVDDIAAVLALRETYAEAQQYRIKGEVVVVAHVGKNIYVQDKNCENTKGHSLMLYDQPEAYKDKFPVGTVLTKVAGSLTIYNTLLEMQYLADDITENGTADVVVSKATIKDVYKDVLYHAALVQFTDVEFDDFGATFEGGKNYRMDDPSGSYMNLHVYATDNIVNEKVPSGKVSVTGYVGVYNGSSQLILRDKSDIVAGTSSANENGAAVKFSAYPNPTSGMLTLDVEENNYSVRVFTVAGVEVMNLKALNGKTQINLEGMAKGIYVVEIATANGTSRAKVVLS